MLNSPASALYREVILDHFQNPRHKEDLKDFDREIEGYNPLCGDRIILKIKIDKNDSNEKRVESISVNVKGCSICVASGSIMAEELIGKETEFIETYIEKFKEMLRGGELVLSEIGDIEALEGVKDYPARIKCALLPWTSLEEAIKRQAAAAKRSCRSGEQMKNPF